MPTTQLTRMMIFLLLGILCRNQSSSRVVDVPQEYATLKIAIDSISPGDTVVFDSGTYALPTIVLHEGYTITSRYGASKTILQCYEDGLYVSDDYYFEHPLVVSGITFVGASNAIRHGYSTGIIIKHCVFQECGVGIASVGGFFTGGIVDSCLFEQCYSGLDLRYETYMDVRHCIFRNCLFGLWLYNTCDPYISQNVIGHCGIGMYLESSCPFTDKNVIWKCDFGLQIVDNWASWPYDSRCFNSTVLSSNGQSFLGVKNLVGIYGNIEAMPSFCDTSLDLLTVASASPLLAANNPSHIDIGGHAGIGCYNGDVDASGGVDIADVTTLIAYLYLNGLPPNPLAAGEIDCQSPTDIADLTYLISYLYLSGPIPYCH